MVLSFLLVALQAKAFFDFSIPQSQLVASALTSINSVATIVAKTDDVSVAKTPLTLTATNTKAQVLQIQNLLKSKGYPIKVDGVIGPKTQAVLDLYKTNNGQPLVSNRGLIQNPAPTTTCITGVTPPSITLTTPNTGGNYNADIHGNNSIRVTWTSCNIPASTSLGVSIEYFPAGGGPSRTPSSNGGGMLTTVGAGGAGLVVPNSLFAFEGYNFGNFFKVFLKTGGFLYNGNNIAVDDYSDHTFSINGFTCMGCNTFTPVSMLTVNPLYTNQTVPQNTNNFKVGSFKVTAGSQNYNINTLQINGFHSTFGGLQFTNLKVLINGVQYGLTYPPAGSPVVLNFTFIPINFNLLANTSATIDVYANTGLSSGNIIQKMELTATNSSGTQYINNYVTGQTINVI